MQHRGKRVVSMGAFDPHPYPISLQSGSKLIEISWFLFVKN